MLMQILHFRNSTPPDLSVGMIQHGGINPLGKFFQPLQLKLYPPLLQCF